MSAAEPLTFPDRLLTPSEAANYLAITPRMLAELRKAGKIKSVPITGDLHRYRLETLREWCIERERRG